MAKAKSKTVFKPEAKPLPVDRQQALYHAALAGDKAEFERIRDGE